MYIIVKLTLGIQGDSHHMLKDDAKDQISLFDLPAPEQPVEPPASPVKTAERTTTKPAPRKQPTLKKTSQRPAPREAKGHAAVRSTARKERVPKTAAGPVPEGDVRLTANIREDLHLKLKIVAATRRTTIGELLEDLVERYL